MCRDISHFPYLPSMNVLSWLSRPYPVLESSSVKLWLALGIGLVCFLFLAVFRPFGLHQVQSLSFISLFGLNAVLSLLLHFFVLPIALPAWFAADQWSIRHQLIFIVSMLLVISVLNYVVNSTIGSNFSPQYSFIYFIFMTTCVGVLPVLLMTYVVESVARQRNVERAARWSNSPSTSSTAVDDRQKNSTTVQVVTITGANASDVALQIPVHDLLYAHAANNYVEIHYLLESKVQKKLLRLTLTGLQGQLADCRQFVRCHKSYIVNRDHIASMSGNARSLVISLSSVDAQIPVSRSLDKSLLR